MSKRHPFIHTILNKGVNQSMVLHNFTNNNNSNNGNNGGNIPTKTPTFGNQYRPNSTPTTDDIPSCLVNLNEKFQHSSHCLYREDVIDQTLATLIGTEKPNPLLVGHAGVGKTKIAEELAHRLANNDPLIPNQLRGYTIFDFQPSNLVAGSGIVGEIEEKVNQLLDFATDPAKKIILFIDEIHMLLSSNDSYTKIAQILKPALSRGDIRVIGATTMNEAQHLYKDPAFERRFQSVIVHELTQDQSLEIIRKIQPKASTKYNITIPDDVLPVVVQMSEKYNNGKVHRPDSVVTLFDRVCASLVVERNRAVHTLLQQPNQQQVAGQLQNTPLLMKESDVERIAISLLRGHASSPIVDYDAVADKIKAKIKGQDDIIDAVIDKIRKRNLGLFNKKQPLPFLWAGPTGTGKTDLAKELAENIMENELIMVNMNDFTEAHSVSRLIGSPAGYVGYDSMQELPFDALKTNPYRIILLDEYEKGHLEVRKLIMTALEEGFIKTARGERISFEKAFVISTSNIGFSDTSEPVVGFTTNVTKPKATNSVQDAVKKFGDGLLPEELNRFKNNIFQFNHITPDVYREILESVYARKLEELKQNKPKYTKNLPEQLSDDELDTLVKDSYVKEFNARPAETTIENWIEDHI